MRPRPGEQRARAMAKYQAFLSYGHEYAEWAAVLHQNLERALGKGSVFRDALAVQPGQSWNARVEEALVGSDTLVLIVTPEAMASRVVEKEVEVFQAQNDDHHSAGSILLCTLVPSPVRPFLKNLDTIDLTQESTYASGVRALRESIARVAGQPFEVGAPVDPPPDLPPQLDPELRALLVERLAPIVAVPAHRAAFCAALGEKPKYLDNRGSDECRASAALVAAAERARKRDKSATPAAGARLALDTVRGLKDVPQDLAEPLLRLAQELAPPARVAAPAQPPAPAPRPAEPVRNTEVAPPAPPAPPAQVRRPKPWKLPLAVVALVFGLGAAAYFAVQAARQRNGAPIAPKLTLAVTAKPADLAVGQETTISIAVLYEGPFAAQDVAVTCELPEGLAFVSASPPPIAGSAGSSVRFAPYQDLAPDADAYPVLNVRARAEKAGRATVLASAVCSNVERVEQRAELSIRGEADVAVHVTAEPATLEIGATATIRLRLENTGAGPMNNVSVTCTLPDCVELISTDGPTARREGATGVSFEPIATLEADDADPQWTIEVRAVREAVGAAISAFPVRDRGALAAPQGAALTVLAPPLELSVAVEPSRITVGAEATVSVQVRNASSDSVRDVAVTCRLPELLAYLTASGPTNGSFDTGRVWFAVLNNLGAGQAATWTIRVRGRAAGVSTVVGTADFHGSRLPPVDQPADVEVHEETVLAPTGLIALGPDPDSKLEEFAVKDTGEVPVRDSKTGKFEIVGRTALILVALPGGKFRMGDDGPDSYSAEQPPHDVQVKPFLIAKTEVTRGVWARVVGGSVAPLEEALPVVNQSWEDLRTFFDSPKVRAVGFRRPSEAEWEYACRAGQTGPYSFDGDATRLGEYGYFFLNSGSAILPQSTKWNLDKLAEWGCAAHPVAGKKPNPFGLFDVHGNVFEWCEDVWHDSYDEAGRPKDGTAWTEGASEIRVLRGGSFEGPARLARSAYRLKYDAGFRCPSVGFRPAL